MADKQPHLNGAYYGPAVPPPSKTYHRPGHGRGCACCLLSTILKIVITLVVVIGLAVLILWLVFRPNKVNFHVTDAALTQFNFTNNNNQLHYNLALNITIRNPNKRIGIYYDVIEAAIVYKEQRLETQWLTPFYQGHKTTSVLSPKFDGQQLLLLGGEELTEFNSERVAGVYDIDVKLYLRVRFKFGVVRIGRVRPKIGCGLKVPLSSNGNSAAGFQTTGCDVDF